MAGQSTRSTYLLAESARTVGGTILVTHGPNCASRSGGDCGCLPTFKLQRTSRRKAVRK